MDKALTALQWMELADAIVGEHNDLVDKIRRITEPIWDAKGNDALVTISLWPIEAQIIDSHAA